jgi:hypothetical protein
MVAFVLLSGAAQVSGSPPAEASAQRATAARIKGLLTEKRFADADRETDWSACGRSPETAGGSSRRCT